MRPDKLNHVLIEGLQGVGRVELTLDTRSRVFAFLGANGVGKTKCLEALYLLFMVYSNPFREAKGMEVFDVAKRPEVSVDGGVVIQPPYASRLSRYAFNALQGNPQPREFLTDTPVVFLSASARAHIAEDQHQDLKVGTFESRRAAYFEEAFKALAQHRLREYGMNHDSRQWFVVRAQSVNRYQKSADSRQVDLDAVLQALHEVDTRIDPAGLQIDGDERVFLKIDGQDRELSELSSGFLALVKLIQSIVAGYSAWTNEVNLRHVPGVVFIDEIESHLHAQWQSRILSQLKAIFPKTTFFVATHSPLVLARLKEGEAYRLQRDPDGTVRSHKIAAPGNRILAEVLVDAFGVDLNQFKREDLLSSDQLVAKQNLLELLNRPKGDVSP
jgi:predicted ATP-binding protein involved in virulence